MPWAPKDAPRFTKAANTAKKKRQWAHVANSALAACKKKGGKEKNCEGRAIKQANAAVSGKDESKSKDKSKVNLPGYTYTFGGDDYFITEHCICLECGNQTPYKDTPCPEVKCSKCGFPLIAQERKSISMRITKATVRDGAMYWQGAVSDDDWDREDERLSLEVFNDFIRRMDTKSQKADYQPPFVSLSHYNRQEDGSGVIGTIENVWVDGRTFTAEGWFMPTRLGKRVFEVVKSELEKLSAGEEIENPVRFSVGFYPHKITWEE